jgi:hypothetical protein
MFLASIFPPCTLERGVLKERRSRRNGRGDQNQHAIAEHAELAERYGWINRALPARSLDGFVRSLAHRIARFPAPGLVAVKERVNAIALAPTEDFRRDSDLFGEGVRKPEAQNRLQAALKRGFQTRDAEMDLGQLLEDLGDR